MSVNVTDLEESLSFYVGVLGGSVRDDRPDLGPGAWVDLGGSQVHLIVNAVAPDLGQHFAILVDDLDLVVGELRTRGIEIGDAFRVGTDFQTFVKDPSGNAVELHQVGS